MLDRGIHWNEGRDYEAGVYMCLERNQDHVQDTGSE